MVTLTFNLDYEKMEKDHVTENDMLEPMREHSKKYGIVEKQKGVFSMDGENALCVMMMYVMKKARNSTDYVRYLKTWILNTGSEVEDCKSELIKIYNKKGLMLGE
jgi:hypothetical protein